MERVVPARVLRAFRRAAIATLGFAVLALGLALLALPVPGTTVVVIPLGLAILGKEFLWARRLLRWLTAGARSAWARVRGRLGAAWRQCYRVRSLASRPSRSGSNGFERVPSTPMGSRAPTIGLALMASTGILLSLVLP